MFRGSSFHTIDTKGRIIIPARFRNLIKAEGGSGIMISRLDNCLVAYPFDEWNKVEKRIMSLIEISTTMRRFRRVFIGNAVERTCDKQDRILIPPTLRQYANLEKDIVLVGSLAHFEIWSRDNWDLENISADDDMKKEDSRNEIDRLGL